MRVCATHIIHVSALFFFLPMPLTENLCHMRRYRYSHISRALRALQSSLKTSLRIDEEGLLSMQFMMPAPRRPGGRRSEAFIEFWVSMHLRYPSDFD